jgi:hypothetical protein
MRPSTRLSWVATVGATALACFLPATAGAHRYIFGARKLVEFHVQGTKSYRVRIGATGPRGVYLIARSDHLKGEYLAFDGKASNGAVEARFPGLGEVDVNFYPSSKAIQAPAPDNCHGRGEVTRHGYFRGLISFRGEHGYTRVNTRSAPGKIVESFRQVCHEGGGPIREDSEDPQIAVLTASRPLSSSLVLDVFAFRTSSRSIPQFSRSDVIASLSRFSKGMSATRSVSASSGLASFALDPAGTLDSATLTPAFPFTGSATFKLSPDGATSTWTGPLTVKPPGSGPIRLAGPRFGSSLCIGDRCTKTDTGTNHITVSVPNR